MWIFGSFLNIINVSKHLKPLGHILPKVVALWVAMQLFISSREITFRTAIRKLHFLWNKK